MVSISQPSGKHKCFFWGGWGGQHIVYCNLGKSGLWLECDTTS